jgi:ubiquinone/menaquinone biosynthesis C-methylase UbiE
MDDYIQTLDMFFSLRERTIRSAIESLPFSPGSRGLDIGCGIGDMTALLSRAVAPDGHVTGLDLSPQMVAYAAEAAERTGLSEQLVFREGDMRSLPFEDYTFDWTWSMDCAGYAPVEPLLVIKEMTRVVKPGGRIAILAWSSQQLLPGYPKLEASLNATVQGIAPFAAGRSPENHFLRALGWFRRLGLEAPTAQTFIGNVQGPLSDADRETLLSLFWMRWPEENKNELAEEDWEQYQLLTQPDSPDFILDLPDYHAFFTYTCFSAGVS